MIRSEQFHRALLENSSDAVLLLGTDLKVRYATSTDARVLGAQMTGQDMLAYVCEEYRDAVKAWLDQIVAHAGCAYRVEFEADHAAGGRRHFIATGTNLREHSAVQGVVVNIRDVTERKLAELEVRRHALYDDLTGLSRRVFFVQQLHKALAYAARHNGIIAVLFLDLDGFKNINDTLGHDAGDQLLKEVAGRLRSALRQDDTIGRGGMLKENRIARLGGNEFTLLLTALNMPENAGVVAQRILDAVGAPYRLGASEVVVTTSVGIAIYPQDGASADDLLKSADAAMYAAKQQGKNAYRFHSAS